MPCTTCYSLSRRTLSGSCSTTSQEPYHDFWILLKPLSDLEKASTAGCSICGVIFAGLMAAIATKVDPRNIQVQIKVPRLRYNRIRAIARCSSGENGESVVADLKFYGDRRASQKPWTDFQRGDVIPKGTNIDSYVAKILSWLGECTKHHKECASASQARELPTRVLDVDPSKEMVTLIDTRAISRFDRYIALSHCWGQDKDKPPLTLESMTLPQSHNIATLPPSFQDAIRLTRALSIRYLWIDSMCILQDCPSDWETESSKMLQYYSSAYLVLAASRAASPSCGFLRGREGCEVVRVRPKQGDASRGAGALGSDGEVISTRFAPHFPSELQHLSGQECDVAPLDKRGWALQERMSARRIVHFYSGEMIWECGCGSKCECSRLSEDSPFLENGCLPLKTRVFRGLTASGRSKDDVLQIWMDLVEHYSRCTLTRDDDKLPAIGGLARMFAVEQKLGRYIAGMWEDGLLSCMLWHTLDPKQAHRPRRYVAPSWSWASLVGQVSRSCLREHHLRFVARVLDCQAICSGVDAFGRVTGGMLRLRTVTWEMNAEYQPAGGFVALASGERAYLDTNGRYRRRTYRLYRSVKCVAIAEGSSGSSHGESVLLALLLEECPGEGTDMLRYRRIGLTVLDQKHLEGAVEETVNIV